MPTLLFFKPAHLKSYHSRHESHKIDFCDFMSTSHIGPIQFIFIFFNFNIFIAKCHAVSVQYGLIILILTSSSSIPVQIWFG